MPSAPKSYILKNCTSLLYFDILLCLKCGKTVEKFCSWRKKMKEKTRALKISAKCARISRKYFHPVSSFTLFFSTTMMRAKERATQLLLMKFQTKASFLRVQIRKLLALWQMCELLTLLFILSTQNVRMENVEFIRLLSCMRDQTGSMLQEKTLRKLEHRNTY